MFSRDLVTEERRYGERRFMAVYETTVMRSSGQEMALGTSLFCDPVKIYDRFRGLDG